MVSPELAHQIPSRMSRRALGTPGEDEDSRTEGACGLVVP